MKTRNKVFMGSGIFLLVVILAGYSLVSAYGPRGYWCGGFRPHFHDRGFHSMAHGKDMAESDPLAHGQQRPRNST